MKQIENVTDLTCEELKVVEGGVDPFTAGLLVGGVLTVGAAVWSLFKK